MDIKKLLAVVGLLMGSAFAQVGRYDSVSQGLTSNNLYTTTPNATVLIYNFPGPTTNCFLAGSCTAAKTFTDQTGLTACLGTIPLTRPTTNSCVGQVDTGGNFGFWANAGLYQYCITATGFGTTCTNVEVTANSTNAVPVEQYGAIGDWNGSTGTDNTAAIQACLNAVTGYCTLQALAYKITGTLTITRSSVGLRGVTGTQLNASVFTAPPPASVIITTSATADIIDVLGTNASNTLANNGFRNLTLERSVVPSSTAKGLNLTFTYSSVVDNVVSMDSIYAFYFKGVGSAGTGFIENSSASWGFNGVTETVGSMYGFYIDSSGVVASPSIRIRNNSAASNISGGPTFYGLAAVGTLTSDLHINHFESAQNMNYGIYINAAGGVGFTSSSDIHIVDSILDSCTTYCLYVTGILGTVTVTSGWSFCTGTCTADIDIESSTNVSLVGHKIFNSGGATAFIAHNSSNVTFNDGSIIGGSGQPISFNAVAEGKITAVDINGTTATTAINLVSATNIAIVGVSINGTGVTTGIAIDAASLGITGLETDTCLSGVTTCLVDNGNNYTGVRGLSLTSPVGSTSLLCSGNVPAVASGFNTGALGGTSNGTCSFFVTIGTGGAGSTGVLALPASKTGWNCFASNQTRADLVLQTASTTTSATLTNYGTTFAATNFTNSDTLLVSCFGR